MKIKEATLKKIVGSLSVTLEKELGCEECNNEVSQYVEMLRAGQDPATVKPLDTAS